MVYWHYFLSNVNEVPFKVNIYELIRKIENDSIEIHRNLLFLINVKIAFFFA